MLMRVKGVWGTSLSDIFMSLVHIAHSLVLKHQCQEGGNQTRENAYLQWQYPYFMVETSHSCFPKMYMH